MAPTMPPPSPTTPSTRRIFPIGDWAPAHEALYPGADNDSSIDTLPFPRKNGESAAASASYASSLLPPRRANTAAAAKHRSMSLPWRPKSTIITVDDLDARVAHLSLQRSRTAADPNQLSMVHEPEPAQLDDGLNHNYKDKGKGKKRMTGLFRRASVSIKGFVHRRTSIATDTLDDPQELRLSRQLRPSHPPSQPHHLFNTNIFGPSPVASPVASPTSPASPASPSRHSQQQQQQHSPRAQTSHAINATWHRLRKATSTSFRHSRVLNYNDLALPQTGEQPCRPLDDLSSPHPRPGLGNDPPVIPRNSGSGARAAVAAWQQDTFPAAMPIRNKRLTLDSAHNDRESGIGIAVTSAMADDAHDLNTVTAEGEVLLSGCAPNRIDFVHRLPAELAIQVLAHLDASGLAIASLVSRQWREVVCTQHVWRESYLREKTGTYATSEPIAPGTGQGIPMIQPHIDWKDAYRATEELAKRWKQGKASSIYLNGHSDSIYCLQFDEQKIITGSRDKTIRIWDMKTMACKLVIGPPEVVKDNALLYDEEGKPVHSASFEPHTGVNGRQNRTTSVPTTCSFQTHHKASILCLQYDDDMLVTGSSDATCIVYDMKGGYRPVRRLRHHTAAVLDLCFDDKYIITCSKDISICVWDRATGTLLKQLRGHSGPVNAVQMRGNTIVSCSGDFRVKLWNIETGKQIREFQGHTKGLACSQFSEDGRFVASAGNDKVIRIWDANTGECLREMKAHESLVRSLHIDSVSGRLVSGSYDTDIKVFDMESGRQLLDFPRWHASWVLSAKSDYRRIVSTGQDPKILVMDFGAGIRGIETLESTTAGRVKDVAAAPVEVDGGYI